MLKKRDQDADARIVETERERREARLVAARRALAELSTGSTGGELLAEIERAHDAVEAAERRLARSWFPSLAFWDRQRLRSAQRAEQRVLAAHGYESWLGLQLRRVDVLFAQPAPEDVTTAEAEHRRALEAWENLAGETEPAAEAVLSFPVLRSVVLG